MNIDLNGDGNVGYALDDRVAFLESRKAAAAIEATDEWNKMEGVAFNENVPEYLYLAMSRIESAMTDGVGDIDLTLNSCGIVYRMTMGEQWNVNRIDPVISGGPYTSSAQYECDINNLAGPDNILVLDDGRVLVGEDTDKHESNMVWLWEDLSEPLIPNGTLSVNYVNLMNTPANKNSTWDYRFQTEVNDLEIGSSYTAIIIIKEFGFDDWKGIWWWNTIEVDGQQYDQTFSLPTGCYSVSASLYESQDLSSDVKNATILSDTKFDFVVGTGTCTDGIYSEEVAATNETGGTDDGIKDSADESVPGFGILVSIVSILGAIVVTHRRK